MNKIAIYTSCNKYYAPRALLLARSVKENVKNATFFLVLVDEVTEQEMTLLQEEFDKVLLAKDIYPDKDFLPWMFTHNVVEACTAIKGFALCHLLNQGYEKVLYMDPDTFLVNPIDELIEQLNQYPIILTPHQVDADNNNNGFYENEITSLKYGVYNLGFLAVNNSPDGNKLAKWWADRLHWHCIDDPARGLFTDQKWFDIVPCLFDNVFISKDPGLNIASWNLGQRRIVFKNAVLYSNHSIAKFFHFTKVGGIGDLMLEKNSITWSSVKEIYLYYMRLLESESTSLYKNINNKWAYGYYSNGDEIEMSHRIKYRDNNDLIKTFQNPFLVGSNSYQEWFLNN